jgi:energy-coupling factor transporter ATP-binding protein EcfA2
MNTDVGPIIDSSLIRQGFTLLAGRNGSGKSRFLRALAKYYSQRSTPVIVICNTPYDRFGSVSGITRLSASRGRRLPTWVLKKALINALERGTTSLSSISRTLEYCGYGPEIGINLRGFSKDNLARLEHSELDEYLNRNDHEELRVALAIAERWPEGQTRWLDFREINFKSHVDESFTRILKWEKTLRRFGVLRGIDIDLKRLDGVDIALNEASSGELTLISTLVFLAISVDGNTVVLIDEPENSLHPQWQKEYVNQLADLLHYNNPTVVIATHAPIIVSGALTTKNINLQTFQAKAGKVSPITDHSDNVEGMLWEAFETVTPENHFVSETLVKAIGEMQRGILNQKKVFSLIDAMESASYDPEQGPFFSSARLLAEKVVSEISND